MIKSNYMEKLEKFIPEISDKTQTNESETEKSSTMKARLRQLFAFFHSKDQEVAAIENSAKHLEPEEISDIKEELRLEEKLKVINTEAQALEKEALELEKSEPKEISPAETYFNQELLPFLKVIASGEELSRLVSELRLAAEKKLAKNKGKKTEEKTIATMKQLLIDRCRETIVCAEKFKKSGKGQSPDSDLLLRSKIITLAAGDTKALEKYSLLGYKERHEALFNGYLNFERSYYSNSKIDADAIHLLMSAGFKDDFLKLRPNERRDIISEYDNQLIVAIIDSNQEKNGDRSDLYNELGYAMDCQSKECSREVYEKMVACGALYYVIKHLDKFQRVVSPADLSDFARHYSTAYPYMLDNLFEGIEKTDWTEEEKMEARRNVLKFHNVTDSNRRYYFNREEMKEFKDIADNIKELDLAEDIPGIKRELEMGRLPYFFECRHGFKTLIENEPEYLIALASRYDQEHLLIHRLSDPYLQELKKNYVEKLARQGDLDIISELEKKGELSAVISKELYLSLADQQGYVADLDCAINVDDEIFARYIQTRPNQKSIFRNINKIRLERPEFKGIMEYRRMAEYVRDFFVGSISDSKIYEEMKLQPNLMSDSSFADFQEQFDANVKAVADYLGKKLDNEEEKQKIISFIIRFGVDALTYKPENFQSLLNEAKELPSSVWAESAERFRNTAEFVREMEGEEKRRFLSDLQIAASIFGKQDTQFVNFFLKKEGVNTGANIASHDLFDAAFRYSDGFASLDEAKQKVLRKIIPGIDRVVSLREKLKESSAPETEETLRKKLADSFGFLIKNWKDEDLEKFCGYVKEFGNKPFIQLFSLYKQISQCEPAALPLEMRARLLKLTGLKINKTETSEQLLQRLNEKISAIVPEVDQGEARQCAISTFTKLRLDALNGKYQDAASGYTAPFLRGELREEAANGDPDRFSSFNYSSLVEGRANNQWAMNLWLYIYGTEGALGDKAVEMAKMFDNAEYRDEVLLKYKNEWLENLSNGDSRLNLKLDSICSTVNYFGGAGNLKHVESLSNLITNIRDHAWGNPHTVERTKKEIETLLIEQEKRFDKEKWSLDARSDFYNLSADIIEAAPSLYSSFQPLFDRLDGKEMKQFARECLPLYQAKLVAMQSQDLKYKPKELVTLRNAITVLAAKLELYPEDKQENLAEHKQELLDDLQAKFQTRFGINHIPEEINKESIRTISNCIRYLGNISRRNQKSEALISLYLSLSLNNEWKDFRAGKDIDINKHLIPACAQNIAAMIEKKRENTLPYALVDIAPEEVPEFQRILQSEVSSTMLGNVQTIDYKLLNLKHNIKDLADPDAFPEATDKQLLEICRSGSKSLNALLAKVYGETVGKTTVYNESEAKLKDQLANIYGIKNWDATAVKSIQDRVRPMNLIFNLLDKMEKEQLDLRVSELRDSLKPSPAIIDIYNRLEEGFKPESGAYASFRDLEYLEGLAVKAESQLSDQEKKDIESYLAPIREKMAGLERLMTRVKEYFSKLSDVANKSNQPMLKERLKDITTAFADSEGESIVQSYLTNDLNLIIENMRQCLGCLRKEINNDTNLSFGDYNKFFLMSRQGKDEGSIADQIVFLAPVKNLNTGEQELNFILDRIYGNKTSDLLVAHTLAVHKKYRSLKDKFKNAKLGVIVSNMALFSVGINQDDFIKKLKEKAALAAEPVFEERLEADIKESAFSDHYVEFADHEYGRKKGALSFSGVMIK